MKNINKILTKEELLKLIDAYCYTIIDRSDFHIIKVESGLHYENPEDCKNKALHVSSQSSSWNSSSMMEVFWKNTVTDYEKGCIGIRLEALGESLNARLGENFFDTQLDENQLYCIEQQIDCCSEAVVTAEELEKALGLSLREIHIMNIIKEHYQYDRDVYWSSCGLYGDITLEYLGHKSERCYRDCDGFITIGEGEKIPFHINNSKGVQLNFHYYEWNL